MKKVENTAQKGSGIRSLVDQVASLNMSGVVGFLRESMRYTISEMGAFSAIPVPTIKNWSNGRYAPSERKRRSFLEAMESAPPSALMRPEDN